MAKTVAGHDHMIAALGRRRGSGFVEQPKITAWQHFCCIVSSSDVATRTTAGWAGPTLCERGIVLPVHSITDYGKEA